MINRLNERMGTPSHIEYLKMSEDDNRRHKPRIFISSTLSENLSIRTKIEKFFPEIGAEAMLYEKNLTPSVNTMTYRKDILDADFIIFIIKNQYGKRTEAGISGTHEDSQLPKILLGKYV